MEVFGHSPKHVQTKSRIGYLPEESYLYRYLNSRETLDFFGNLFHLPPGERQKRADQLLEMVGLNLTQTRAVGEFSKGMQRRIGLAQALINDPDLVILDEPTAGLDPIGCREVKDLIIALARRGKTVILSSHLLSDVEDVCDRVVIYYGGKVQALGTLKELLATPDAVRITTPVLSRETMERVLEVIRKDVDSAETSGAQSGARVAEYLRAGGEEKPAADKLLERLTLPTAAQKAEELKSVPTAPAVSETKLAELTKAKPAEPAPAPAAPSSEGKPAESKEDLSKANEKLSSLLGGKKQ
jgi:ABC-2 type transport system ATP-binding protein